MKRGKRGCVWGGEGHSPAAGCLPGLHSGVFKLHYQKGRRQARKIGNLQKNCTQGCKTHALRDAAANGKQLILLHCPQHGKDMRCVMELL